MCFFFSNNVLQLIYPKLDSNKVYILHLFYMCVKPFKVCNSSFFMFSLAIYLLKGMSLRLLIFQIWLFVSSWFYLTCSSISRIPCKIIVRLEAWLKSGSNSLEEYFYISLKDKVSFFRINSKCQYCCFWNRAKLFTTCIFWEQLHKWHVGVVFFPTDMIKLWS